jgi:hypothetical protein
MSIGSIHATDEEARDYGNHGGVGGLGYETTSQQRQKPLSFITGLDPLDCCEYCVEESQGVKKATEETL